MMKGVALFFKFLVIISMNNNKCCITNFINEIKECIYY